MPMDYRDAQMIAQRAMNIAIENLRSQANLLYLLTNGEFERDESYRAIFTDGAISLIYGATMDAAADKGTESLTKILTNSILLLLKSLLAQPDNFPHLPVQRRVGAQDLMLAIHDNWCRCAPFCKR